MEPAIDRYRRQGVALYRTHQAAARANVTPRQLQHWDEQGWLVPLRDGHARLYSEWHVRAARLIRELRVKSWTWKQIKNILPDNCSKHGLTASSRFCVASSDGLAYAEDEAGALRLAVEASSAVVVVDLGSYYPGLLGRIMHLRELRDDEGMPLSYDAMAERLGTSKQRILQLLQAAGLHVRQRGPYRKSA